MAVIRNSFGEDRIAPTLGWVLIPAGATATVPDEDAENWAAGGWEIVPDKPGPAKTTTATTPAAAPAPPEGTAQ